MNLFIWTKKFEISLRWIRSELWKKNENPHRKTSNNSTKISMKDSTGLNFHSRYFHVRRRSFESFFFFSEKKGKKLAEQIEEIYREINEELHRSSSDETPIDSQKSKVRKKIFGILQRINKVRQVDRNIFTRSALVRSIFQSNTFWVFLGSWKILEDQHFDWRNWKNRHLRRRKHSDSNRWTSPTLLFEPSKTEIFSRENFS